eukprot:gene3003-3682_t
MEELSEQSNDLRTWIQSQVLAYRTSVAHSNALPLKLCVHPSIFVDESRFGALPTLVQTELIHSFLAKHTGLSVSYAMVKRVLGFHGLGWGGRERPRESVTVRSLSLSNDWELTTDGERLVVRARKSQPSARSTAAKSDFQENRKDLASVFNLGTEGWTMEVTGKNDASDSGLDPRPSVTGRITVTHPKQLSVTVTGYIDSHPDRSGNERVARDLDMDTDIHVPKVEDVFYLYGLPSHCNLQI